MAKLKTSSNSKMTAKSVRSDSVALGDINGDSNISTTTKLHQFMTKYEQLDKERRKYMICFFALFALIIIFLTIILIGLTADNNLSPSNIDTCQSECASTENDFVTLTEIDTDTPIATFDGYLDVLLQQTNLTNYSRILSNNGQVIDDLQEYLYALKQNLSAYDGDIIISVQRQIFEGNVDYDILIQACSILFTGNLTYIDILCSTTFYHLHIKSMYKYFRNHVSNDDMF